MTEQSVIETRGATQAPEICAAHHLRNYFAGCRVDAIKKYRAAQFWTTRRSARDDALHYGRLVRKMEGRG